MKNKSGNKENWFVFHKSSKWFISSLFLLLYSCNTTIKQNKEWDSYLYRSNMIDYCSLTSDNKSRVRIIFNGDKPQTILEYFENGYSTGVYTKINTAGDYDTSGSRNFMYSTTRVNVNLDSTQIYQILNYRNRINSYHSDNKNMKLSLQDIFTKILIVEVFNKGTYSRFIIEKTNSDDHEIIQTLLSIQKNFEIGLKYANDNMKKFTYY